MHRQKIYIPACTISAPFSVLEIWSSHTNGQDHRKNMWHIKGWNLSPKTNSFIRCVPQLKLQPCAVEQISWWQSAEFFHHFRFPLQEFHLQHSFLFLASAQRCADENFCLKGFVTSQERWKHYISYYSSWIWKFVSAGMCYQQQKDFFFQIYIW